MKAKSVKNIIKLVVFASVLLFSCALFRNLTGSWSGPLTLDGDPSYELQANITQNGDTLGGDASIWNSGIQLTTYTISATLSGNQITGQLLGTDVAIYNINISATTNDAGTAIDATFDIPDSGATGSFSITKL